MRLSFVFSFCTFLAFSCINNLFFSFCSRCLFSLFCALLIKGLICYCDICVKSNYSCKTDGVCAASIYKEPDGHIHSSFRYV